MAQRRLMPMDIVLYARKLWVVSTAHLRDSQGRQLVNLTGYKRREYIRNIHPYKCKIVHDEKNRGAIEVMPGMYVYPDTDFEEAPNE